MPKHLTVFFYPFVMHSSESSSSSASSSISSPGGPAWTPQEALATMYSVMRAVSPPNSPNKVTAPTDLAAWKQSDTSSASNQLGRGANGAVYLVRHAKTNQPIAVKKFKLPTDRVRRTCLLHHIRKEATIQKTLSTWQHFPKYYGWIPVTEHEIALAMEFVGDDMIGVSTTLWKALKTSMP